MNTQVVCVKNAEGRETGSGRLVQDGTLEACVHICEIPEFATSCWTTIDRRILECTHTQKKTPSVQRQRRNCNEKAGGGAITIK